MKKKRRRRQVASSKEEMTFLLSRTCSWCGSVVPEDTEVFGMGATAADEAFIEDMKGEFIPLELTMMPKTVRAFVVPDHAEAKAAGQDFMFMTCSQSCADSLKKALERETGMIGQVLH